MSAAALDTTMHAAAAADSSIARRPTHFNALQLELIGYVCQEDSNVVAKDELFGDLLADPVCAALVKRYVLHYALDTTFPTPPHSDATMQKGWAACAGAMPDRYGRRRYHLFACACTEFQATHNKRMALGHIFKHHASTVAPVALAAWEAHNPKSTTSKSNSKLKSKRPADDDDDAYETPVKKAKTSTYSQSNKQASSSTVVSPVSSSASSVVSATSPLSTPLSAPSIFAQRMQLSSTHEDFEAAILPLTPTRAQVETTDTTAKSATPAISVASPTRTQERPAGHKEYAKRTPPPAPTPLTTSTTVTVAHSTESTPQKTTPVAPITTASPPSKPASTPTSAASAHSHAVNENSIMNAATSAPTPTPTLAKKTAELGEFASPSSPHVAAPSTAASCESRDDKFSAMEALIQEMRRMQAELRDEAKKTKEAMDRALAAEQELATAQKKLSESVATLSAETRAHEATKQDLQRHKHIVDTRGLLLKQQEAHVVRLAKLLEPAMSEFEAFKRSAVRHGMPLESSTASASTSDCGAAQQTVQQQQQQQQQQQPRAA